MSACKRTLGDENSIKFWGEVWCGDHPLKVMFPRIYALDENKWCIEAQRINIRDWKYALRRSPRGGVESSQFSDLMAVISDVALSDSGDGWKWYNYSKKWNNKEK
ncbi:RNA-directed DNA polymerase, eukaryota, Reverse transcriptase zinc-binding domain protein [Artemisia annua]|uniref:RNA-directed DNA polymerase, eukaryota, Reverse transcriptase zinc-binding domain protein n=1 Tax=Artemisia annua TaxID=35608 RepID=A0A2U1LAE8_ARTAN|nr:RNA-directed DNA polymerase, eukaryota, Reverse transcriptase zinc-binding domain protein [Artemisia annua]